VIRYPRRLNRIHLLYNTLYEKETLEPLATVAEHIGYDVEFSNTAPNDGEQVEIGIYCGHAQDPDLPKTDPTASVLSIVMLHDLGQEMWPSNQTVEANFWHSEPWNVFDVGILPGPAWSEAWRVSSALPAARPRIGVFELGYPKADHVFNDKEGFAEEVQRLKASLKLTHRPSILLAPSWESDDHNRSEGFIRALGDLDLNLLVKYEPGAEGTARRMAERYDGVSDNVTFIDVDTSILTCLALSDVIVSDESNCLAEALLFDVPGVAVVDWDVPAVPSWHVPQRPVDPPEFAQQITADRLRISVQNTLLNLGAFREEAHRVRDDIFTNLGSSAEAIVNLIDSLQSMPFSPLTAPHK
jgi:hypothetical protein